MDDIGCRWTVWGGYVYTPGPGGKVVARNEDGPSPVTGSITFPRYLIKYCK